MQLSEDQSEALELASKWLAAAPLPDYTEDGQDSPITVGYAQEYPVLSIGGYAGTGKTTILRHVGEAYGNVTFVTPTHKAAQVLRGKLSRELSRRVQTFHSLIYAALAVYRCDLSGEVMTEDAENSCDCQPGEMCEDMPALIPCGRPHDCRVKQELKFERRSFLPGHISCIVVDEASMLTEQEVNDIRAFGVPVMLVGDHGQLPPVKAQMNPWIKNPRHVLTVNHRQGEESGIPDAASEARSYGRLSRVRYGSSVRTLKQDDRGVPELLERFRPDAKARTIIVQYNVTRAVLNQAYHDEIAGESVLVPGDRIISLQRCQALEMLPDGDVGGETFVFNGSTATVDAVEHESERIIRVLATLDVDWRGRRNVQIMTTCAKQQFGMPAQMMFNDKPRSAELWDYAYALTAHKAQGSEFDQVIVFQENAGDKRWLYTACTRAKEALIVITP